MSGLGAVKMRLDGTSLKDTAALFEMSRTTVVSAVKAHATGGWRPWTLIDLDVPPARDALCLLSRSERCRT
jgi:hypothetical protein